MHIKLVVVAAPDGGIVGPSVDVHCMGQGVVAASSLHHRRFSAICVTCPCPKKGWGQQIHSLVQCHYSYCPMTCLLLFCTQTAIIVYQMWLYVYQLLMLFIACKNTMACWAQHADAATVALPFPHTLKAEPCT